MTLLHFADWRSCKWIEKEVKNKRKFRHSRTATQSPQLDEVTYTKELFMREKRIVRTDKTPEPVKKRGGIRSGESEANLEMGSGGRRWRSAAIIYL